MATTQGQDIICCQFCPNPVEHHCNLCHVDLCLSCIPKHMADKSREHEVVGYSFRKKHPFTPPLCLTHKINRCETYCQDCSIPICIQCMMGSHRKHEFTDISDILREHKQKIKSDTEELENRIVPKYRNINLSTATTEFDKVLSVIKEQEDKLCKAVRKASIQLTEEVTAQKTEVISKYKENQYSVEKEINQIVQKNKETLKDNDATVILNYQSQNNDFRSGPELPRFSCPKLIAGIVKQDQIVGMFGFLQNGDDMEKKPEMLKMMDVPMVLGTMQIPFGGMFNLWSVQCVGKDKILTSGDDAQIKVINRRNGIILKAIETIYNVRALTINSQLKPVFSTYLKTNIYRYKNTREKVEVLLDTPDWFPVGLWYAVNGDLLASMRSTDRTQSRVVRYSGNKEIQKIQYDSQGQPLFSTGVRQTVLHLTENGNGDICVADCAGKAVVVVNSSGGLRFKYTGNLSIQSKYREFRPSHITTDVNTQILISDTSNEIVHIIDCDGNFVRYIDHPGTGGLSIDGDHNLVLGHLHTGEIKFIKYLES
ncbi:uncharacterized protein LOC134247478 [Saccostrea cucullata]|uniref:uncharacterized protein LOC134247478 n=1 Tax=Saccostrea cuccullata TaxID=36930 RepID=UPI002ED49065